MIPFSASRETSDCLLPASACAIAPVASGYAALAQNNLMDELAEDMTGLTLRFDRVKIPSAASPVFEVPGDGEDIGTLVHN